MNFTLYPAKATIRAANEKSKTPGTLMNTIVGTGIHLVAFVRVNREWPGSIERHSNR